MRRFLVTVLLAAAASLAPPHAKAGIPVIDITAVANLIQQVMYWQQQISGMQKQYDQLKESKDQLTRTHNAMTGSRGMEQLLPTSPCLRDGLHQDLVSDFHFLNAHTRGHVEAMPKLNHRAYDERLLDLSLREPRIIPCSYSPLHRSQRVVFPKVDALAQPVILVYASGEMRHLAAQHLLAHEFIAAMEAQHHAGQALIVAVVGK